MTFSVAVCGIYCMYLSLCTLPVNMLYSSNCGCTASHAMTCCRCNVEDPFDPAQANAPLLAAGTDGLVASFSVTLHEHAAGSLPQPGKQSNARPSPSPMNDPFAASQPAHIQQQRQRQPGSLPDSTSDHKSSRRGKQQQAGSLTAELGKWLHVYVSPPAEHEQSLKQEGHGWMGDASKGLSRLELPPLGAESSARASAVGDAPSPIPARYADQYVIGRVQILPACDTTALLQPATLDEMLRRCSDSSMPHTTDPQRLFCL